MFNMHNTFQGGVIPEQGRSVMYPPPQREAEELQA
jgi:hypothetical protein